MAKEIKSNYIVEIDQHDGLGFVPYGERYSVLNDALARAQRVIGSIKVAGVKWSVRISEHVETVEDYVLFDFDDLSK